MPRRLAIALVLVAAAALPARAGAATLTLSPLAGTPDASPRAQVSLLGVPLRALRSVSVVGSSSGRHRGRLRAYSTGNGASFIPARPFDAGERVTVRVRWRDGSRTRVSVARFAVAHMAAGPPFPAPRTPLAQDELRFHSRPDLRPPALQVTARAAGRAPGDLFVAPLHAPGYRQAIYGQFGPMIFDDSGGLVWSDPLGGGQIGMDFRAQTLEGRPVLTWWQGRIAAVGYGSGEDVIMDSSYHRIAAVQAGNGYRADLHEFVLGGDGTAWLTAYTPVRDDLSRLGGTSAGTLTDCVIQQIDIKTGLVEFEWHALGHIPIADSYYRPGSSGAFDGYHLNSIDPSHPGSVLVSVRNTWAVYDVSRTTGRIAWQLGGHHSSFRLGRGARFAWQHDALFAPGGVTIFDNEATPVERPQSRALYLKLDSRHRTANVLRQYQHPTPLSAISQGNVELLANGDVFVDWGAKQAMSEFSPGGRLLFDARFPGPDESYRAFRVQWTGTPTRPPDLALARSGGTVTAYASWNGATTVASWQLLAGPAAGSLAPVTSVARGGFETAISTAAGASSYFAVSALDAGGHVLGTSRTVHG